MHDLNHYILHIYETTHSIKECHIKKFNVIKRYDAQLDNIVGDVVNRQ